MKALAVGVAALVFGTPAFAQSFNIDVGDPAFPSPSMAYAAGSTQAGVWNAWGDFNNTVPWTQTLVDITGAATGVTMTGDYAVFTNGLANFNFDNANTFGDDEALLDDLWDMGAPVGEGLFTITGLVDGSYDVYTYAFAPDSTAYSTTVSVTGSPDPPQLVHDVTGFGGGHGLGITYAKHRVTVAGGSTVQVHCLTTSGFGSNNGIQITPADQGPGTNYCSSTINSTGAASVISATGSASISANNLVLSANNLPSQPGIFIAGPTQQAMPLYCGTLCVGFGGLQRFSNTAAPTGGIITEAVDYATSAPGGLLVVAGQTFNYQRWNRDPAGAGGCQGPGTPNDTANFSDAVAIMHTP